MSERAMRSATGVALLLGLAAVLAPSQARAFAFTYDWRDANDPPFRADGLPNAHYWAPCVSRNLNGAACDLKVTYNLATPLNAKEQAAVNAAVQTWQNRAVVEPDKANLGVMGADDAAVFRKRDRYDLQTDVLHELGHAIGLDHPEMGRDRQPLTDDDPPPQWGGPRTKFTASTRGDANAYHLDAGNDGNPGTADDKRDADRILHLIDADNNPFNAPAGKVDSTTYKAQNGALPAGAVAQAPTRLVGGAVFHNDKIEAAMVQDLDANATRRILTWDDANGLAYLESGRNQIADGAGAADNFKFHFTFDPTGAHNGADGLPPRNVQILISKAPPNTLDQPSTVPVVDRSAFFTNQIVSLALGAVSASDAISGNGDRDIIGRTELWLDAEGNIAFADIYIPDLTEAVPEPRAALLVLAAALALCGARRPRAR